MPVTAKDGLKVLQQFSSTTDGSGHIVIQKAIISLVPGTTATALGKAEDAAHASGDTGVAVLGVRRDTAAVGSGTDGDYSTLNVDATGKLWVTGVAAEDDAHASGDKGHVILARRKDSPAASGGTDGDYSTVDVGANGALWVTPTPATQGGCDTYRNIDLGSTGVSIKGSAGQVYGWYMYNRAASERVVKFYDKATAATVGTDTPKLTIPLPAGGGSNIPWGTGIPFALGISVGAVTEIGDSGTTNPSANDVVVNILYK